jgi:uncharacterized protein (DUF433 family)
MQLEDYFNFLAPDDIRLKGSRIGIESVLYEYIFREQTPQEIVQRFPTLSLEQVYATILYYHHKKEEMDKYMTDYIEWGRRMREEQERNPPPAVVRLNELRKQRLEQQRLAAQGAEQE